MHRVFKKLIDEAVGQSEFVVVVNVDVRGFSSFSKTVESPNAAMFIKRVYKKIIDNYFPNAIFFKPTGDGLLLLIPYDEKSLKSVANEVVETSLKLVDDFRDFCKDDPMINFSVPDLIGIGVSRGSACRLTSKKTILDYSGSVLNLASRLMDIARPSGVVFDSAFGIDLLSPELSSKFATDEIYVKGIAESEPVPIFFTSDKTVIQPINKNPINKANWQVETIETNFKEIKTIERFRYKLKSEPIDKGQVTVTCTYPKIVNLKQYKNLVSFWDLDNVVVVQDAGIHAIFIDYRVVAQKLTPLGMKDSWKVSFNIKYCAK